MKQKISPRTFAVAEAVSAVAKHFNLPRGGTTLKIAFRKMREERRSYEVTVTGLPWGRGSYITFAVAKSADKTWYAFGSSRARVGIHERVLPPLQNQTHSFNLNKHLPRKERRELQPYRYSYRIERLMVPIRLKPRL